MALSNKKQLTDAIFYAKEKPELLFNILFPLVRDNAVNTVIRISGDSTIQMDSEASVASSAPVVEVFDQYGIAIASPTVTFAIKSAVTGCAVNSTTGVLTITNATVTAGAKPVVVATAGTLTAELTITVLEAEEAEAE